MSNAIYVIEIALVPLLVLRRTRAFAVCAAILFLVAIETAAREWFFGLISLNMLLLFCERDYNRRLVGVFAAALAGLLLMRWGVFPEVMFQ